MTSSEVPIFAPFPKIKRLSRDVIVTEKIDGTNASVYISDDLKTILAGSRTRWITPEQDNHGFAKWVVENGIELLAKLGPGHHFGEWWGRGVQRGYNQIEKKFSLFNTVKWSDPNVRPSCCGVTPVLYEGPFDTVVINEILQGLKENGSKAAPGYMYPEGIVVYHKAANICFKKTIENDDKHKGE